MARVWPAAALSAALLALATQVGAQAGDASRAASLFNEGRTALEAGEYAKACAKFEESMALVPRPSTTINLAQCHEKQGHLVKAFELYRQGIERLPSDDPKLKAAVELLDALTKRLPRLSVKLPADLPTGAKVQMDGKVVEQMPVQGIPVDPGQHALILTAPGRADVRTSVTLVESQQLEVTLQLGEATGAATASTPSAGGTGTPTVGPAGNGGPEATPATSTPGSEPAAGGGSPLTTAGFVVGGIGIASFIAAGITGGVLLSRDSDIKSECPDQKCSQKGADLISGSKGLIVGNWITWGVGIAGVGVGAVLLGIGLTAKDDGADKAAAHTEVIPLVGPGLGGLSIQRSF
jgi:hypothetical protein